jgi:hypothetical protein
MPRPTTKMVFLSSLAPTPVPALVAGGDDMVVDESERASVEWRPSPTRAEI